jgi:hypothetical protein
MLSGNLLKGLAAIDRFYRDLCLALWTVGSSPAHRWQSLGWGGAPPRRLTMEPVRGQARPAQSWPPSRPSSSPSGKMEAGASVVRWVAEWTSPWPAGTSTIQSCFAL